MYRFCVNPVQLVGTSFKEIRRFIFITTAKGQIDLDVKLYLLTTEDERTTTTFNASVLCIVM